jgi:uncharacterized protein YycO
MNESLRILRDVLESVKHRERSDMICVKVRGYTGHGFGSKWIQRWTRSKISHVSLVFYMGDDAEEVEAIQFKGVVAHAPHSSKKKTFVEYDVPLTYEQVLEARELALSLVGARYDWRAVRSFIRHRRRHSMDKWMCSELVAYVLLKVGYKVSRREPFLESPSTVCESLRLLSDPAFPDS